MKRRPCPPSSELIQSQGGEHVPSELIQSPGGEHVPCSRLGRAARGNHSEAARPPPHGIWSESGHISPVNAIQRQGQGEAAALEATTNLSPMVRSPSAYTRLRAGQDCQARTLHPPQSRPGLGNLNGASQRREKKRKKKGET